MNLDFISLIPVQAQVQKEPVLEWFVSEEGGAPENVLFETKTGFEFLSFEPTISNSGRVTKLDAKKEEEKLKFGMNLAIWNYQTSLLANNRFENVYFHEIVKMKEAAVPFILEELQKGPTPLVHALSLIYPNTVQCEGYVPLDALCSLWEDILKGIVKP